MTLDINNDSHNSMVCSSLTFHPPPGICFLSWEGQDPQAASLPSFKDFVLSGDTRWSPSEVRSAILPNQGPGRPAALLGADLTIVNIEIPMAKRIQSHRSE